MKTALLQLNVTDDPATNVKQTLSMIRDAASDGARFILTPEVTNCISNSRRHQNNVLQHESEDQTLTAIQNLSAQLGITTLIGSLALKTDDASGRFANRSFLIDPSGSIKARYDKIHMFDVNINAEEAFQESKAYRPGDTAVIADAGFAKIGMTICYDVRFPHLHRTLAHAGAQILTVPAAFAPTTGAAHWETLLRARAIETGCFVLAPAQTGTHATATGTSRTTYGHSIAIDPWGGIIAKAGVKPGPIHLTINLSESDEARQRVPSIEHDRQYTPPHEPNQ
ncbi:MAG: carbon-nitrogen hydrolase family protein [Litoreibacter sp.]